MTTTTRRAEAAEEFTTSEGLRAILNRLRTAGTHAWQYDCVAADLVAYTAHKYAALARKHGLDPWEAASAAFEVMRFESTRAANDPWAVITHAVRITCIAEERARGLLCSTHQARRPHVSVFHDPERISDRETPLSDYHPAFQVTEEHGASGQAEDTGETGSEGSALAAVEDCVALITGLGWPPETARTSVEHVCAALAKAGSRASAYESLRHDKHARAFLDLPADSWSTLLKALLGNPHPALRATAVGRGVLLRLVIGETVQSILRDDHLVLSIVVTAPIRGGE
ncbi:hypothetical protein [Arthrobacter sp. TB 23]|uniref:hypothetical protein n=1 Tax=Arthrobacter sp. TB 23 TaxID=494419 RepID=UPI0003138BD8|nr:hypothetical protein [Arthrobacter sp. TB 23]